MVIHSFDGVLRQGRTLHSIEVSPGKRIALPRPVPGIAFLYFFTILAVVLVLDNFVSFVGVLGAGLSAVSGGDAGLAAWVTCYLLIPGALVWLAMNAEIDGRAPHRWVVSAAHFAVRRKRTMCGRPARSEGSVVHYRGKTSFWWDDDAPRLQHGWVRGGRATTTVRVGFVHSLRHRRFVVKPDERGELLDHYDVGEGLEVRR